MNGETTEPPAALPPGTYTSAEVRTRIRVYVVVAVLASVSGGLTDLAAMTDDQLNAVSFVRWGLKLALIATGAAIAGYTAFRAAIDRSTAGGSGAPANPPSATS